MVRATGRQHGRPKGNEEDMKQNLGKADRLIRAFVVAPVALVLAGLAGWTSVWGIVALVVAALMFGTAAIGNCPPYALLGLSTCKADPKTNS
jgi:fatty acid desaturase